MRVNGFRRPNDFEKYFDTFNDTHDRYDHKYLSLKLHPCILETPSNGKIRAKLDSTGRVIEATEFQGMMQDEKVVETLPDGLDPLDRLSYRIYQLKNGEKCYDFKRYDYPWNEYEE